MCYLSASDPKSYSLWSHYVFQKITLFSLSQTLNIEQTLSSQSGSHTEEIWGHQF